MRQPVHRRPDLVGAVHHEVAGLRFAAEYRRDLAGLRALGDHVAHAAHESEDDRDAEHPAEDTWIAQGREAPGDEEDEEREHDRAVPRLERTAREVVEQQSHDETRTTDERDHPGLARHVQVDFDPPLVDPVREHAQ